MVKFLTEMPCSERLGLPGEVTTIRRQVVRSNSVLVYGNRKRSGEVVKILL